MNTQNRIKRFYDQRAAELRRAEQQAERENEQLAVDEITAAASRAGSLCNPAGESSFNSSAACPVLSLFGLVDLACRSIATETGNRRLWLAAALWNFIDHIRCVAPNAEPEPLWDIMRKRLPDVMES